MKFRFLHCADIHLGYRQYGSTIRENDFARAFLAVVQAAIGHGVDFVLLAGDLFHKRSIDAQTLNQALAGFDRLEQAGIPCVAIEGNHELEHYDENLSWMHFLALRRSLTLLRPAWVDGAIQPARYEKARGSWVDVLPGVRVHGLRYHGAGTRKAIDLYAEALAAQPCDGVEYTIFLAHTGVEGVLAGDVGSPTRSHWTILRPWTDYVALGHIHKPFDYDDWIYNPGSLEANSVDEAEWPDRGYWLVEVDTAAPRGQRHRARLHTVERRPIVRAIVKVDLMESHTELVEECERVVRREAAKAGLKEGDERAPIVDLLLTGVLGFDRQTLLLDEIEQRIREVTGALVVLMRNNTQSREARSVFAEGISRQELERQVLAAIYEGDVRYRAQSTAWAKATMALKQAALAEMSPEDLVDELAGLTQAVYSTVERTTTPENSLAASAASTSPPSPIPPQPVD